MIKKIISLVMIILISTSLFSSAFAEKNDTTPSKDLLLITENQAEYDKTFINQNQDLIIDIVEIDDIKEYNTDDYFEIAAPITAANQLKSLLRRAYSDGKKVYLYGNLTIEQYNEVLNLDKYGIDVPIEV